MDTTDSVQSQIMITTGSVQGLYYTHVHLRFINISKKVIQQVPFAVSIPNVQGTIDKLVT